MGRPDTSAIVGGREALDTDVAQGADELGEQGLR
jgi:hypothetical protein